MDQEFKDQVVIVTGGGQGIGAETARQFHKRGAKVAIVEWNEETAIEMAEELQKDGGEAIAVKCDVSKQEEANAAVDTIFKKWGRIDVLINNAGITRDSSMLKLEPHQWDQVIGVNLSGVFYVSQAAIKHMKEAKYGRVVTASSTSQFGNFGQANYAATKAGVVGLTRTMALEFGRYNITSNAVAPGFTQTAMTEAIPAEQREGAAQRIPVQRIGQPIDIAMAYVFFASPSSGFVNGQLLVVDGGSNRH